MTYLIPLIICIAMAVAFERRELRLARAANLQRRLMGRF